MSRGIFHYLLWYSSLKFFGLVPTPGMRLLNGRTEMPVPWKTCNRSVLYSFFFCCLIVCGCDGFSQLFQCYLHLERTRIQFSLHGQNAQAQAHTRLHTLLHHIDTVGYRMKVDHSCLIWTEIRRSCSRHSSIWGGEGVASSMWRVRCLVVLCFFLLADGTKSDQIYLELPLASGSRVQSISSKSQSAAIFCFLKPVLGKCLIE